MAHKGFLAKVARRLIMWLQMLNLKCILEMSRCAGDGRWNCHLNFPDVLTQSHTISPLALNMERQEVGISPIDNCHVGVPIQQLTGHLWLVPHGIGSAMTMVQDRWCHWPYFTNSIDGLNLAKLLSVASLVLNACYGFMICTVDLPGGPLQIEWKEEDNHVYMTGSADVVYYGSLPL
ncbi:hypothetical protein ACSQ67_001509 [Phaseolus vulgaris]